jgi:tRNA nucleotidyltransferase/poly(A) polymerase
LRAESIIEDLKRRDFTINALALSLTEEPPRLIDPTGGLRDLRARRIRVTDPRALTEDPLRLLRSIRLAAQLDFGIEKSTAEAIRRQASLLRHVAAERLREEFFELFQGRVLA